MSENPKKKDNKKKKQPEDRIEWRRATNTLYVLLLVVLASIVISQLIGNKKSEVGIPFYVFEEKVTSGEVREGVVIDQILHGVYKDGRRFHTTLPPNVDSQLIDKWEKSGVRLDYQVKRPDLGNYLISFLPYLILVILVILLLRRMQGVGPKGLFSFGKSKARLFSDTTPKLSFTDVAGADEAKEELYEIIEFLRDPKKFVRLGGRIPRGCLLLGPPGTGKTLLAKAVAGEAGVPFYSISGAEFVEMFVGVGASRVRDLFETGKKNAPCIIFIDEIDAVGRHRGAGLGGGHDEREQTLNQLLIEMDGFEENDGVILGCGYQPSGYS